MGDQEEASTRRWVWLAAGVALQLIANGRWIVAPATWLAPVGWLVFLERSRLRAGIPVAFALFLLVELVCWRGLVPAPGLLYYLIVGSYAIVYFLPFVAHRLLARRVAAGVAATLVFPAAWVGLEFVLQRWVTPYGSWFSIAYTQIDCLPLVQIAAFTGAAGISFLVTWFAALAAWAMDRREPGLRRRGAVLYGLVLAACIGVGEVRLAWPPAAGGLVRVAGILPSSPLTRELEAALGPARRGLPLSETQLGAIEQIAGRLDDDLFARTVREARAGAQLVAWSETAGRVMRSQEAKLLQRAQHLAQEEKVDLVLAYGVWIPDATPPFENKAVAVSRDGRVAWQFLKARPIVGPESPFVRAGDGVVRAMAAPFGSVGAVICHDLDFPDLLRQANDAGIGLIVGPSADWPAITTLHADMAALRAIESGFSLFRPTSRGRSIAVDSRGRTLMAVDHANDAVVAQVPAMSVPTLYAALGDWLGWVCLAGLIGAVMIVAYRRLRRGSRRPTPG